ncbi:phosphatase PAP2 family protein [Neptuniibacter sp.]|uniref:phosphatase PAP2 family protein n=1 Tax=Neptuniibacter sp. TaxID=1962643 RepID=UPI002614D71A|nr:phosphatase PAP2 family protein [Neptuniibacter sp.]MCP4597369.1 phosphatase PAP2 family protein [Neptuniibacter sp.]
MSAIKLLTTFDLFAFNWCLGLPRAPELAKVSRQVSRLGDGGLYLVLGMSLAVFELQNGMLFFMAGLLAYSIELPLYLLLKNTIKRDRPCDALPFEAYIVPSDKFSFPSGHSAAAFVFATLIAHFYPGFTEFAYSLAVLVGVSRVLLGVHYPTDIVAGAALGMSSALIALNFLPALMTL